MSLFSRTRPHQALTNFFVTLEAAEKFGKLEQQLRAENAELIDKFMQRHQKQAAEEFAKYKQKLQNEAAEEVAMYKAEAFKEAAKAATVAMRTEFERIDKIRESNNNKELAQLKKDLDAKATEELFNRKPMLKAELSAYLERIEINVVAWAKEQVEFQLHDHNKFQDRMELQKKNFELFKEKWYINIDGIGKDGDAAMHIPHAAAVKLLARNPQIFGTYKTLCIKHMIKYQRELKGQFQNHLNDIEQECMQWLGKSAGNGSKIEALNGLKQTVTKGRQVTFNRTIKNLRANIENVEVQITQEDLNQEAAEIMRRFEILKRTDISEGGLKMPRAKAGSLEPAIKRRVAEEAGEIMKLADGLNQRVLPILSNAGRITAATELSSVSGRTMAAQPTPRQPSFDRMFQGKTLTDNYESRKRKRVEG